MCDISVSFKFCNQLLRPTVRGLDRDRDIGSANGKQQWQGAGPDHPAFPTFQTCCWNVVYFVCRRFLKAGNGRICFFFVLRRILVPFALLQDPGRARVQLSTLIDTCAWPHLFAWQILLRLRFQSVGISTSNPWCRRFVPMLPSRFRSS